MTQISHLTNLTPRPEVSIKDIPKFEYTPRRGVRKIKTDLKWVSPSDPEFKCLLNSLLESLKNQNLAADLEIGRQNNWVDFIEITKVKLRTRLEPAYQFRFIQFKQKNNSIRVKSELKAEYGSQARVFEACLEKFLKISGLHIEDAYAWCREITPPINWPVLVGAKTILLKSDFTQWWNDLVSLETDSDVIHNELIRNGLHWNIFTEKPQGFRYYHLNRKEFLTATRISNNSSDNPIPIGIMTLVRKPNGYLVTKTSPKKIIYIFKSSADLTLQTKDIDYSRAVFIISVDDFISFLKCLPGKKSTTMNQISIFSLLKIYHRLLLRPNQTGIQKANLHFILETDHLTILPTLDQIFNFTPVVFLDQISNKINDLLNNWRLNNTMESGDIVVKVTDEFNFLAEIVWRFCIFLQKNVGPRKNNDFQKKFFTIFKIYLQEKEPENTISRKDLKALCNMECEP